MTEHDALDNNPHVSRQALAALHEQLYGWSLSRCGYDPSTAEDLMQQAYVEILSGRARFDEFLIAAALLENTSWAAPSDVLLPQHRFDIYREIPAFIESTKLEEGTLL